MENARRSSMLDSSPPIAERDEVPRPGELGDAGRRQRQHLVGADAADVEHLAPYLDRHG